MSAVLVADLNDLPEPLEPRYVASLLDHADLWLVLGESPIHPKWVELAARPHVTVLPYAAGGSAHGYTAVAAALLERLRGPSPEQIAASVMQREPALRRLESLVRAVCTYPWQIRRPRDLAFLSGTPFVEVKRGCADLGFGRVEHFIVCVRALAFEQLVARCRLPLVVARRLSGFDDPSNMRRHVRRAQVRSPAAASLFRSLCLARSPAPARAQLRR